MSNQDKPLIVLKRSDATGVTGFNHAVELHHADGVNVLALFGQDTPLELCRQFANAAAQTFEATLSDETDQQPPSFGNWLIGELKQRRADGTL